MSAELAGPGDWTATVEQAVAVEIVRRRRWLRAYLALVLGVTLATLALVWLQRAASAAQLKRQLQPVTARTQRLSTQQVALARHQMDLADRLTRLEAEAAVLIAQVAAERQPAAARLAAPAAPAPAPALARSAWRQDRLDSSVAALQRRLHRLETRAPAVGPDDAARARLDAGIGARLDGLDAALRALEAAAATAAVAPAPPPALDTTTAQRLEALDRRLDRLERTAVRAGAASLD